MKKIIIVALLSIWFGVEGGIISSSISVDPHQAVIVWQEKSGGVARLAALELQKHLALISGVKIPVVSQRQNDKYNFVFAGVPSGKKLPQELAVYEVTPQSTQFYGTDSPYAAQAPEQNILFWAQKLGTMYAVYEFLEQQFQVQWIWPGEDGIIHPQMPQLQMRLGRHRWQPQLQQREMGSGYGGWKVARFQKQRQALPQELQLSVSEYLQKTVETRYWLFRVLRMGSGVRYTCGHAFVTWWGKYGKTHPEYFSLQQDGVRRPFNVASPHTVKLCVSNPAVADQVVANWRQSGMPSQIDASENDSRGYCLCPQCQALDVRKPGEKMLSHLSDRYIYFANAIAERAIKFRPDVKVAMHAYSNYVEPPRREKVRDNIALLMVPFMLENFDAIQARYSGWRQMGGKIFVQRPNDQWVNIGLPMGYEKRMYEHFQLGIKNNIHGVMYDSLHNYWQANGIADYILARAIANPRRTYESLFQEYCAMFGAAAPDIARYFNYWRENIFEKKIMPDLAQINRNIYGDYKYTLFLNSRRYYSEQDFNLTDALLKQAAARPLNAQQRQLVKKLQLGNHHARLIWRAVCSANKLNPGRELLQFRIAHRDKLDCNWWEMLEHEYNCSDICGTKECSMVKNFAHSESLSRQSWFFCLDPQNLGLNLGYPQYPYDRARHTWDPVRTGLAWEHQTPYALHPKFYQQLKKYDGIAWYCHEFAIPHAWRGKKIALLFGGIDESAWVWLNGKFAGQRIYKGGTEWLDSVEIPITDQIDWQRSKQTVMVRVEDKAGLGGLFKNVYLVARDQK